MARKLSPPSPGSIAGKTSLPQPDDRIASISVGEYLSLVEVERYLQHKPPSLRDVALELRNLVATVAPQAAERILWKGLSYQKETGWPSDLCASNPSIPHPGTIFGN
jgi:hypothetical protein